MLAGPTEVRCESRGAVLLPSTTAGQPMLHPSNTTYHQSSTTTRGRTDERRRRRPSRKTRPRRQPSRATSRQAPVTGGPRPRRRCGRAGAAAALRAFESANDRAATPAERKLLRDLAARFEPVAATAARSGTTCRARVGLVGGGRLGRGRSGQRLRRSPTACARSCCAGSGRGSPRPAIPDRHG